MMRHAPRSLALLTTSLATSLAFAACASSGVSAPAPVPAPAAQPAPSGMPPAAPTAPVTVTPALRAGGPWSWTPTAGNYNYVITTEATLAPDSGGAARALSPTNQHAVITVSASGDVQAVDPPAPQAGAACDTNAALATRAQELIPHLPQSLAVGATWTDSSTTSGCRGPIPATTHVQSGFVVVGDTVLRGVHAVQVHRADTLAANGEGASGQHRIHLQATGTAATELFFDPAAGRFIGSDRTQVSAVAVTTSGRTARFEQRVREHVELVATP